MNIPWLEHPKFEADDIIASLATHWAKNNGTVYISSNDFDFTQLVSDKVHLIRTVSGKLINCNHQFVTNKFGITPDQYVDYLSLVGDKTDNISGCTGIGPKTASTLLNTHKNINGIFNNIDTISPNIRDKLMVGRNIIESNKGFIAMNRNIPISEIITDKIPDPWHDIIQQKIAIHLNDSGLN
jgi:DNA polymerase-1